MTTHEKMQARIMQLCDERNITLNKLAVITGITQSTLNCIINNGTNAVSMRTVERICKGLGMSIYEFFDTEEFKKK